ncbi:MAG TPA: YdjY domain-containing protein [Pirellulales bacterium]|nr:YdjY domain-containing protein [Pirellulales bacterium]
MNPPMRNDMTHAFFADRRASSTARKSWLLGLLVGCALLAIEANQRRAAFAQPDSEKTADSAQSPATNEKQLPGLTRLSPKFDTWLDKPNKRVVMLAEVCLRDGQMEMFACLKNTKEHESIISVPTEAMIVHAALIAAGAEPGHPARFRPTYQAASGTEIVVTLFWSDDDGQRHRANAEDWLKNLHTGKPLDQPWVFGGSAFWTDQGGVRHYQAEDGDFICVSNFPSAMLDLPIESSQSNNALLFEAMADRIPSKGKRLSLVLTPRLKGLADDRGGDPKADVDESGAR